MRAADVRKCAFVAATLVSAILPPGVTAAELDISGDYGDEAGCRFAKTNNYSEAEILLLTRQYVTTQVTQCSFVQIYPAEADSQVAIVSCGHEGEETTTLSLMRVQKSPDGVDAYLIFDQDGSMWGKAGRC